MLRRKFSEFLFIPVFMLALFNNMAAQKMEIDSVLSTLGGKTYLYKGHIQQGEREGCWTGTDVRSDSVKYYLIYRAGYLLKLYSITPLYGPQLQFEVTESLDTLKEYSYNEQGALLQKNVWKIRSDTLLKKNCLSFCAKEEGAVEKLRQYRYNYRYLDIEGMTEVMELNYGGHQLSHYYYNGEYVCTYNEKGKCISGDKKRYQRITRIGKAAK